MSGELGELDAGELVVETEIDDANAELNEDDKNADDKSESDDDSDKTGDDTEKKDQGDELTALRTDLETKHKSEIDELKKEINRLGFAMRENDKLKKQIAEAGKGGKKDDDVQFTDAQILQMMKDHNDEPEVLFQIMKHMQKQTGESLEKAAENREEFQNKRTEIRSFSEKLFPNAFDEGTEISGNIDKTVEYLGVDNHPLGREIALGMMAMKNLPNLIKGVEKDAEERVRKELLNKTANDKRKGKVSAHSLADKGSKSDKDDKKTPRGNDTIERLGMNERQQKLYQKFMSAKKTNVTMQAEA